jgi:SSS family solute:Na+ symporter
MSEINWTALTVFIILFVFVTALGFWAARWRRGDLTQLHEWGLGGRRFGTLTSWFLIGGDLYTAYTFIAVPALAFGAGAVAFFAVPYTILIYPILFVVFPRLWTVSHKRGYVTASDFVRGRFGNRWLALAITITGIVATMPYIALQLVGLQVVIGAMGIGGTGLAADLPLLIAFVILAAFTYSSGLRAPAAIAIVKDILIYIAVIAAVIVIPDQMGGYGAIFAKVPAAKAILAAPPAGSAGAYSGFATLALGSAVALFLYPHSITGILAAQSAHAIRRNAAFLPAYSLVLGLLTLMGFMALVAGVSTNPQFAGAFKAYGNNFAVPALYLGAFPDWFSGVAFAAIGIGALVPASIMSIAAANLFTRNIYKEYINANCTPAQESQMAKWASLVVKAGALVFIIWLPLQYSIYLQLLGGVWIIQTVPAVLFGLYTRKLHPWALWWGWAAGIAWGTWQAYELKLAGSIYPLKFGDFTFPTYAALSSLVLNIVVGLVLTWVFNALGAKNTADETLPSDYVTK